MKKILFVLLLIGNYALAQNDSIAINTIEFDSDFSYKMLDQNQNLRKVNILLEEKMNGDY